MIKVYYSKEKLEYSGKEAIWREGEDKQFKPGAFDRQERECFEAGNDMTGFTKEMGIAEIYETAYGAKIDAVLVNFTGGTILAEDKYRKADDVLNHPDIYIEPEKYRELKIKAEATTVIYRNYVRDRDLVFVFVINNINEYNKHKNVRLKDCTVAGGYSYEDRYGLFKDDAYIYTKGGTLIREPRTKECRGYPIPKRLDIDFDRITKDKEIINNI